MAISRITTWSAGNTLTAAALNAEFDNYITNALSLVSPWTANMAAGGFGITNLTKTNPFVFGTANTGTVAMATLTGSRVWTFPDDTGTVPLLSNSSATVATSETMTTATYTDLATSGPAVTLTVPSNGKALIVVSAALSGDSLIYPMYADFALSSGNTRSASDTTAISGGLNSSAMFYRLSAVTLLTSLSSASTTFTMKYRSGNSGNVATFKDRALLVLIW